MAIEKSLYEAPMGLETLAVQEAPLEIEIVDPEEVVIGMGDMEITLRPEDEGAEDEFEENLAKNLDSGALATLGSELMGLFEADSRSRKDWVDLYVKGLKLLGVKPEERTEPWPGACGVFHPLLIESAVKFQSETMSETFPAAGPVKTQIIGKDTKEKEEAATRVKEDMNYELTERMTEYRSEHERMLFSLCLSGNAFKKVYFDPSLQRQAAIFVPAEEVVVPYGASNLDTAQRVTHVMRKTKNELRKLQVSGFYVDIDLGEPVRTIDPVEKQKATEQGFSLDVDDRFQLLEMHVDIDPEEAGFEDKFAKDTDGVAVPYVITIERGTQNILAIRRNWRPDDDTRAKRQHFVHYPYVPGFGFYAFGLVHLIGGHTQAATSLIRQLVDAGTLANLPGGFKARGLRVKGDDTPIAPGEFRDVDVPSGSIRDNLLPLPYKEPSQALILLLDKIVADAQRFASTADMKVSDMSAQAPVGTTLAILERTLKVMSAVQARIHYAMKQEFKLLRNIIRDNREDEYFYEPEVGDKRAKRSDYDMVEVIPVSDPNAATMSQKVVQYQAVMQMAQQAPQLYDLKVLHRQMLEVLGVKNAAKLVPTDDDMKPVDPVTENMAILMGKPVKAFQYQDHEAHIQVHMAAVQDPKIMQVMGQNPMAQTIMAAAAAHITEHVAHAYRREIEKQLGSPLPDMKDTLPPELEVQVSQLAAQAAARLLQKDQAEAAMQQAQQQMQDPLVQMQQKELAIREKEAATKEKKVVIDAAARADELRLKEKEVIIKAAAEADRGQREELLNGLKIGVDIAKGNAQMRVQAQKTNKPKGD
jgi:chaperonin GroES